MLVRAVLRSGLHDLAHQFASRTPMVKGPYDVELGAFDRAVYAPRGRRGRAFAIVRAIPDGIRGDYCCGAFENLAVNGIRRHFPLPVKLESNRAVADAEARDREPAGIGSCDAGSAGVDLN